MIISHSFSAWLSGHGRVDACGMLWSSHFLGSSRRDAPACAFRSVIWRCAQCSLHGQAASVIWSKYGKKAERGSAGNKDQTGGTKSDVWHSARKGRGGQDLSGGGGKTNQAEVDVCAVLWEGVGVRMHEGTTKREESAEWVCTGEAQSMAWVVLSCAWEADACRVRIKPLWFPNAHI